MKALILTGGLGTRLRPLTLTTLKPLLPIANIPFLHYPISLLRKAGAREVVLCASNSSLPYRAFISAQKKLGTKLICSRERKVLGTGGAIKNAERYLDSSSFFAMNGDSLTNLDFKAILKFHKSKMAAVTLALIPVEDPSQYGLVMTGQKGEVHRFIEKPTDLDLHAKQKFLINAGIYIFEREVLSLIPEERAYSVERDLFPKLLQKGWPVFGYSADPSVYWMDIGTSEKFLQANADVVSKKVSGVVPDSWITKIGKNSRVDRSVRLGRDVTVGSRCAIGKNSILNHSVLLNNVRVGADVTIENCVIGNHCKIGDHSKILNTRILGDRSIITPYSRL